MSNDRDEQVKRLAEAMEPLESAISIGRRYWAERLYAAGARIPAPPAPVMPVISDEALRSFDAFVPNGSKINEVRGAILRAAWPHLLRDSVAALTRQSGSPMAGMFRLPPTKTCGALYFHDEQLAALLAILTGAAPDGA